jgi:hypothetical protein
MQQQQQSSKRRHREFSVLLQLLLDARKHCHQATSTTVQRVGRA